MRITTIIFLGFLLVGLSACQKEITGDRFELTKAEKFQNNIGETDFADQLIPSGPPPAPGADRERVIRASKAAYHARTAEWPAVAAAFDALLQEINAQVPFTAKDQYDLEFTSFQLLRQLNRRAPAGSSRAQIAARTLRQLTTHMKPVDLHLLAGYYNLAISELTESEASNYRKYIERSAKRNLKGKYDAPQLSSQSALADWQARYALNTLNAARK